MNACEACPLAFRDAIIAVMNAMVASQVVHERDMNPLATTTGIRERSQFVRERHDRVHVRS